MNAIAQAQGSSQAGPQLDRRRVVAGLVDLGVLLAGSAVLGMAASAAGADGLSGDPQISVLLLAWGLFYYFALESGDGQTLGKKLLKLRVVRADGRPAGMREVAVRTVLRVVDGLGAYLVGLI
ncbi:MAG TPA: RDD family protein, partial [Thermoleophilaceae bacterium]|nr:RDD family protein [Thermoleophilaceae bacterium]